MDKITVLELIKSNSNIFSLPQVISELINEASKEDFSADDLTKIVLKDPSLTGRILKMANSSFYNRLSKITTVQQAISIMGINTVKCLALSSSIFHPDKVMEEAGVDTQEYFTFILSAATAAKLIAEEIEFKSPDEAFIAGLLHDIGFLFLLKQYPHDVKDIMKSVDSKDPYWVTEKLVFGINHSELSKEIADSWHLPENIVNALDAHHEYKDSQKSSTLSTIVKLSVLLSSDSFSNYEYPIDKRMEGIACLSDQLNLEKEQVQVISSSLSKKTLEFAEYLGVNIGSVEEMLIKANEEIWKSFLFIENLFKERQELSKNLLNQEREKGAMESKNIAMATLSHYLNNAVMAIFGRTQIIRMHLDNKNTDRVIEDIPDMIEKIDQSVHKIIAVIEEMKEVSPIDQAKFNSMSKAMNIDDRIAKRLQAMTVDTSQLHPANVD